MKRLYTAIFLFPIFIGLFTDSVHAQTPGQPAPLPNRTMISLSGYTKQNKIELKGALSASHSYDKMIIERGDAPGTFVTISEINVSGTASSEFHFNYLDLSPASGTNYYRIKLINSFTRVNEITHTLMIKMNTDVKELEVVNTILQGSSAVLTVRNNEDEKASVQTFDMSGQPVRKESITLHNGTNNISLPGLVNSKGFFMIVVKTKNKTVTQRVWVQ